MGLEGIFLAMKSIAFLLVASALLVAGGCGPENGGEPASTVGWSPQTFGGHCSISIPPTWKVVPDSQKGSPDAPSPLVKQGTALVYTLAPCLQAANGLFVAYDPDSMAAVSIQRVPNDQGYEPLGSGKDTLVKRSTDSVQWDESPEYGETVISGIGSIMLRGHGHGGPGIVVDEELYTVVTKKFLYGLAFIFPQTAEDKSRPIVKGILSTVTIPQ